MIIEIKIFNCFWRFGYYIKDVLQKLQKRQKQFKKFNLDDRTIN
jgi:hypothetical protein